MPSDSEFSLLPLSVEELCCVLPVSFAGTFEAGYTRENIDFVSGGDMGLGVREEVDSQVRRAFRCGYVGGMLRRMSRGYRSANAGTAHSIRHRRTSLRAVGDPES